MSKTTQTKLFINNEYVNAKSGKTLEIRNPADGSLVASNVQVAGTVDVDDAVEAATAAFKGPWRSFTGAQRGELLHRFADLLTQHIDEIFRLETMSMGIPISVIKSFAGIVPGYFHYYAGYADKLEGDAFPPDDGVYKIVQYEPLGVVASIASWNMTPLYYGWKIAPALATGNTVIFKASEKSPLGALALGELFVKAGFPPGVVNFVTGGGETGHLLARHQNIRKISFTGSVEVGRKVQQAATASNLKRVTLELGGKNPAIVFDDADVDQALAFVTEGFLFNSGQVCAAASRVYVHEDIAPKFITGLKINYERASQDLGASPLDARTTLGPVADEAQLKRVLAYIEEGKQAAQLVTGGTQKGTIGFFIEPTIFLNPAPNSKIYRQEIFGPVIVVKTFKTEDEVIELANDTEYGLSACIYTENISRALRVASRIESGTVAINSAFMPNISTGFGGQKQSGNGGRESGKYALHDYLEAKTIHIKL